MHEYFLTRSDGTVVFDKPDQPGRLAFLREEFMADKPGIHTDLVFEFPEGLRERYESLYLKLIPSYSGCTIAVRVRSLKEPNDTIFYEPFVPLPENENIMILVKRKNNDIDTYTNVRLQRACPSFYFFSNQQLITPKIFPFLTNTVPQQDAQALYEQGELSVSGAQLQEFYRDVAGGLGSDKWRNVTGSGFANETDRLLVPETFAYCFPDVMGLTAVKFILKDSQNNVVYTLDKSSAEGIPARMHLDFSGKDFSVPLKTPFAIREKMYTLDVTGDNGYNQSHFLIFSNDLYPDNPWAVIDIGFKPENNLYNLLAGDGFLFKRKQAGVWQEAPVFEIPVKSRLVYYRFFSNRGKALKAGAAINDYVNKEGNVLVSKMPRSVALHWFKLKKTAPAGEQYVPNPVSYNLKSDQERRLLFDIAVPQSDLFEEV